MFRSLLIVLGLLVSGSIAAQDVYFTQLNTNRTYFNPAFSGLTTCQNFGLSYRNHYPTLGVYESIRGSYDAHVAALNGGLGVQYIYDSQAQGAIGTTYMDAKYSYQIPVNDNLNFSFGLEASYRHSQINTNVSPFPDQIDNYYGFVRPSSTSNNGYYQANTVGMGLGVVAYSKFYYVGLSVQNIFMESQEYGVPVKYTLQAGYNLTLHESITGKRTILTPQFIVQEQGNVGYSALMVNVSRSNWMLGVGGRMSSTNPDAIIAAIGYSIPKFPLSISYNYDITIGQFGGAGNGAHELGLVYRLKCSREAIDNSPFSIPMI